MGNVIACLIAFIVGVGLAAGISYANINQDLMDKATKSCDINGGLATLRSNMWNDRTVICNNGAQFNKFGE